MITVADIQQRIAEELDITHMSKEDQARISEELGGMIYQRLLFTLFEHIPEMRHEELKQRIVSENADGVTELVHRYVSNVSELIEAELNASLKEYRDALHGSRADTPAE